MVTCPQARRCKGLPQQVGFPSKDCGTRNHQAILGQTGYCGEWVLPGINATSIRSVVVFKSYSFLLMNATREDLEIKYYNVKTAYLHGNLKEAIHMQKPEGFIQPKNEDFVCLFPMSLYGLE